MDRSLGKPQKSQASTKIRAGSGHACMNAERTRSFSHHADPDDCQPPGWRSVAPTIPTNLPVQRIGWYRLTTRLATLASFKAPDKDGTLKKELYR
jgi:hypothetical protein